MAANDPQPVRMMPEWLEPNPKPKRQVNYNQDVILCPVCKKRIRLNNNGRVRVHMSGKIGSSKCVGSDAELLSDL